MIGIGIDTGGTYTDAVIYDLSDHRLLASGKSLTTKEDLKTGIRNVLKELPEDLLASCSSIALSTTLATNACVENKGGNGKLVLIGIERSILESSYQEYGIESLDDVLLLECTLTDKRETSTEPDWELLHKSLKEFAGNCDCISIVQLFAKEHLGGYEKRAAEIIKSELDIPVILGHDLFPDRNILRRGSGALLNARLIPVIHQFMDAIRVVFREYGLTLPIVIVKSNGNLMSSEYTCLHPVETLLCGPAASTMGAKHLAGSEQAVIVDMGGTTTDISIIRDGRPLEAKDGIQVGGWKTFVKGLYVDTFALGGDTAVHYNYDGDLYLENYRVMPLCMLSSNYPGISEQIRALDTYEQGHTLYLYEFLILMKDITGPAQYTDDERRLCEALKGGPLMLPNAAKAIGRDVYTLKTERLEADSVILRAGLTPTDIMHIRGDFSAFDRDASLAGAGFTARYAGISIEELSDRIYGLVKKRLYCNLVRILLQTECPEFRNTIPDTQLTQLIEHSYGQSEKGKDCFFNTVFRTNAVLIGVGAPTHVFLSPVAGMLGTKSLIPAYASVANAVGAVVGNIAATAEAEVCPSYTNGEVNGYKVITRSLSQFFREYEDALCFAEEEAQRAAEAAARQQGAGGNLTVTCRRFRKEASAGQGVTYLLEEKIRATATEGL